MRDRNFSNLKICAIPVEAFAADPTPAENGALLARMNSDDQAESLMHFGEQLRNTCGGREFMQWQYIADSIKTMEEKLLDGSASQLISEIGSRLSYVEAA